MNEKKLADRKLSEIEYDIWDNEPKWSVGGHSEEQLKRWIAAIVKEFMKCEKWRINRKGKKCKSYLLPKDNPNPHIYCDKHGYQKTDREGTLVKFLITHFELTEKDLEG